MSLWMYSWGLTLGATTGFFMGALYGPRLLSRYIPMRNKPVLQDLLTLLGSATATAAAMMDNCFEDGQAIPPEAAELIRQQLNQISRSLDNALAWPVPPARVSLPTGHRLPTHLDSYQ